MKREGVAWFHRQHRQRHRLRRAGLPAPLRHLEGRAAHAHPQRRLLADVGPHPGEPREPGLDGHPSRGRRPAGGPRRGRGLAGAGRGRPALRAADQAGRGRPHDLLPAVGRVRADDGRLARLRPVGGRRRRLAQARSGTRCGHERAVRIGRAGLRAHRPHARGADRPPDPRPGPDPGVRRAAPSPAEETAAALGGAVAATPGGADRAPTTSTPSPSAPPPTPTSTCWWRAPRPASRSSARSRSRSTWPRSTGGSRPSRPAGVLLQVGFNRRYDPSHRLVRDRVDGRRHRRAPPGADHQPRPGAAAHRLHRGLGRDLLRHDDPRLRHGPLRHRTRDRRGVRHWRRTGRPGHRRRPATSTPRSSSCATPTGCSPPSTTAARPCTATTSGSRPSARAGMVGSENAADDHDHPAQRHRRASSPTLPDFFRERYEASYLAEWEAFVAMVARRRAVARDGPRRPRGPRRRSGRLALGP